MDNVGEIKLPLVSGNVHNASNLLLNKYTNCLIVEFKFVNLTSESIVVHFRDGTYSILTPELDDSKVNSLVIGHGKRYNRGKIAAISGEECSITNLIRSRLQHSNGANSYWEESISLDTMRVNNNGIYIASADVIVSLADRIEYMAFHPFCKQYIHNMYLNLLEDFNSKSDFCLGMRLIDNEGSYRRIYAVIHNGIVVIHPKKSNVLSSGFYISGLTSIVNEHHNDIRKDVRYSIEEAIAGKAPIKVFKTLSEAQELLDACYTLTISEKAKDKEHEAYIADIKLAKEKLENANALLKVQQAQSKLVNDELESIRAYNAQILKDKQEENIQRRKEEYIYRGGEQKLVLETVKTAGVLLAAALAAYKIFK